MKLLAAAAASFAVWAVATADPVLSSTEIAISAGILNGENNLSLTETGLANQTDDKLLMGNKESFQRLETVIATATPATSQDATAEREAIITATTQSIRHTKIAEDVRAITSTAIIIETATATPEFATTTATHKSATLTANHETAAVGSITAHPTTITHATYIDAYGDVTEVDDFYLEPSESLWISPIGEDDEQFDYESPERMLLSTVVPLTSATEEAEPTSTPTTAASDTKSSYDLAEVLPAELDVDAMGRLLNDTKILHKLAQSDIDAIEICRSYAFDASQLNWHISQAEEWMRQYSLENKDREYFKRNGLIATIAFDFLGMNNYKCAIGFTQLCTVDCPTVVRGIDDLELARKVYFVMASALNMLSVLDTVHGTMVASQMNLQGMVQKMSMDFFYTSPTEGERERQRLWHFFVQLTIWSAQTAINSVVPLIPWSTIQDYVLYRVSKLAKVTLDHTGRIDRFDDHEFDEWRGRVIEETLGDIMYTQLNNNIEPLRVPPRYGGHYRWNPGGATISDWMRVNSHATRMWEHYFYDRQLPMCYEDRAYHADNRRGIDIGADFRRRATMEGFWSAVGHAWKDTKELVHGTYDRAAGMYQHLKHGYNGYIDHLRHTEPPSHLEPGQRIASIGGESSWHPRDQWRKEYGPSRRELLYDIWTRGISAQGEYGYRPSIEHVVSNITIKLDNVRTAMSKLYPVALNLAMPMYIRETMESFTFSGTDKHHEVNSANLAFMVQESGRYSRRIVKQNVNAMFGSSIVGPQGETHLSNALAMGNYLPVDKGTLNDWTDASIEDAITKNMYYKTLDAALRSQKHWIQCTTHLLRKKHMNSILHKVVQEVSTCIADNTGPEHLRSCLPPTSSSEDGKEMVCYMYRWADRGIAIAHHIEDPWGWEKYQAFDLSVQSIISSSFLTRAYRLSSNSTTSDDPGFPLLNTRTLAFGPDSEFVTDPGNPGMFSLPVCVSPYNWNGHTKGYSFLDDMDVNSAKKSLPCYCGPMGADTRAVWSAMRLDISEKRGEYLKHLCPRQIAAKMKNPLERYVAKCRLGIKKVGALHYEKRDHLCDVVIAELEAHDIRSIDQISDQQTLVVMCKVRQAWHNRWNVKWRKKCRKYRNTPISAMWEEAAAMNTTIAEDALDGFEEERLEEAKGMEGGQMEGEQIDEEEIEGEAKAAKET